MRTIDDRSGISVLNQNDEGALLFFNRRTTLSVARSSTHPSLLIAFCHEGGVRAMMNAKVQFNAVIPAP